jgi:hypothetical protein
MIEGARFLGFLEARYDIGSLTRMDIAAGVTAGVACCFTRGMTNSTLLVSHHAAAVVR